MDLRARIPNNVGLESRPEVARLLEWFQPRYLDWWREAGPEGFDAARVYLRTPTGVDTAAHATFGHVRLPEYRWGVYQVPPDPARRALFGAGAGGAVWQTPPDEHRRYLIRVLTTQGDTEPGSVEQSRRLGSTAPSLYDLRNLLQINVEEGRHLWAMVHLLLEHFGPAGRSEAEGLLERRSGSVERPRLLSAFNSPIEEWLSFYIWSFLADRDGKFQLMSLSESAFDPLARTTRFMLTEEAFHMFVGDDGLQRVIRRTVELMREHDTDDVAPHGGINLITLQRYLNYWAPQIYDLFGHELSPRAYEAFSAGLKGRAYEPRYSDHVALEEPVEVERRAGDELVAATVPAREALNEVVRREYLTECERLMARWNRVLESNHIGFAFRLPDRRFNRRIGVYGGLWFTPAGRRVSREAFEAGMGEWFPSGREREHVQAVTVPVLARGKMAGWIAPPERGIGQQSTDFEYVRL